MHWQSLAQFFHMGGYGKYVWPAYILTLLILGGNLVVSLRRVKQTASLHKKNHDAPTA